MLIPVSQCLHLISLPSPLSECNGLQYRTNTFFLFFKEKAVLFFISILSFTTPVWFRMTSSFIRRWCYLGYYRICHGTWPEPCQFCFLLSAFQTVMQDLSIWVDLVGVATLDQFTHVHEPLRPHTVYFKGTQYSSCNSESAIQVNLWNVFTLSLVRWDFTTWLSPVKLSACV